MIPLLRSILILATHQSLLRNRTSTFFACRKYNNVHYYIIIIQMCKHVSITMLRWVVEELNRGFAEKLEEMFLQYYIHSDKFSMFKSSTTQQ